MTRSRVVWLALLVASGTVTGAVLATPAGAVPPGAGGVRVVVAELFTSEGCSSCPPADALLREIEQQPPVDGVEVVALEEHVDYWDQLGWRDPFSSALFTRRQSTYERAVFHTGDIFTPQLIVNGSRQCVGSDRSAVTRAMADAIRQPQANVRIDAAAQSGDRVPVSVAVALPPDLQKHRAADIVMAVTEDGLATAVRGGENRGRTLAHGAVVRAFTTAGTIAANATEGTARGDVVIAPVWKRASLHIVAFVQEHDTLRVLGAAATSLK